MITNRSLDIFETALRALESVARHAMNRGNQISPEDASERLKLADDALAELARLRMEVVTWEDRLAMDGIALLPNGPQP